jgi:selenocysteine-specific elongation factor
VVVSSEAFAEAAGVVRRLIEAQGPLSLAAARDALATNRRVAQAVLETLDRRGVTRRQGEARVLTAARPVPGPVPGS